MNKSFLKELVAFSNQLDADGLQEEASKLDSVIQKLAFDKGKLLSFLQELEKEGSPKSKKMIEYLKDQYKDFLEEKKF